MSWGIEKCEEEEEEKCEEEEKEEKEECEEEEKGEPIWLEDNDSEVEEEVSVLNQSAIASQSTHNISPNALKTFAVTVHLASNYLQSLDISAGDWSFTECPPLGQIGMNLFMVWSLSWSSILCTFDHSYVWSNVGQLF